MEGNEYHNYTECDTRYACIKRLDFIVAAVTRLERERSGKLNIIEIGCGNGNISLPLASLGHSVVATDVDRNSITLAKQKSIFPNARFFVSDGENLCIKKEFDVVVATEVLEHVQEPVRLISMCRRLLESQGLLILTVPNGYGPFELATDAVVLGGKVLRLFRLRRILEYIKTAFFAGARRDSFISSNPESYHVQKFTRKHIQALISGNGFRIISVGHSDFLTPVLELPLRFRVSDRLHYADWWLADRLPHAMVSGWYFLCEAE